MQANFAFSLCATSLNVALTVKVGYLDLKRVFDLYTVKRVKKFFSTVRPSIMLESPFSIVLYATSLNIASVNLALTHGVLYVDLQVRVTFI